MAPPRNDIKAQHAQPAYNPKSFGRWLRIQGSGTYIKRDTSVQAQKSQPRPIQAKFSIDDTGERLQGIPLCTEVSQATKMIKKASSTDDAVIAERSTDVEAKQRPRYLNFKTPDDRYFLSQI